MISSLNTFNVALDTSIVEAQNFLAGTNIKELGNLSKKGALSLFITDITYREIIARFNKNVVETDIKTKKIRKDFDNAARVLKDFPEYKSYFQLPTIEVDDLIEKFKKKFDKWIEDSKITVISTAEITIGEVFIDYFSNKPPFKEGVKKHEFPDAFTLHTLVKHFQNIGSSSYIVSTDNDLLSFKNECLYPTSDLANLIDLIIRSDKERKKQQRIKFIEKLIQKEKPKIISDINDIIYRYIDDEVTSKGYLHDFEDVSIDNLEVSDVEIERYSIVHLEKDLARIECEVSFDYEVLFTAKSSSEYWNNESWDEEGHEYEIAGFNTIPVSLTANLFYKAGLEFSDIDVVEVNNGKELSVYKNLKRDY